MKSQKFSRLFKSSKTMSKNKVAEISKFLEVIEVKNTPLKNSINFVKKE